MTDVGENLFGKWLHVQLKNRKWTQAELARRANLSRSAINGVIQGVRRPGRDILGALAKALTLPPEEIFAAAGVIDNPTERPIAFAEWVQLFLDADDNTQKELLDYARFAMERKKPLGED
jgi:transcriptional regulator with XRE-family HTH domain